MKHDRMCLSVCSLCFSVKDCSFAVCKLAGVPEDYIDALLDEKYMEDLIASQQHPAIRSQGVSKIEHDRGIYNEDEHSYGEFINLIWLESFYSFWRIHTVQYLCILYTDKDEHIYLKDDSK